MKELIQQMEAIYMTKAENGKCEKLMYEAIRNAQEGTRELRLAYKYEREHKNGSECVRYQGFNHLGYAEGINQVLAELGFKHEKMKELYKYI